MRLKVVLFFTLFISFLECSNTQNTVGKNKLISRPDLLSRIRTNSVEYYFLYKGNDALAIQDFEKQLYWAGAIDWSIAYGKYNGWSVGKMVKKDSRFEPFAFHQIAITAFPFEKIRNGYDDTDIAVGIAIDTTKKNKYISYFNKEIFQLDKGGHGDCSMYGAFDDGERVIGSYCFNQMLQPDSTHNIMSYSEALAHFGINIEEITNPKIYKDTVNFKF